MNAPPLFYLFATAQQYCSPGDEFLLQRSGIFILQLLLDTVAMETFQITHLISIRFAGME